MRVPGTARPNLSQDVAFAIRERILDGRLAAGEHLKEESLARDLGVSRTPVREALVLLAAERAVRSLPRRGYFVCELTLEEARDIYPIRSYLDPEALRLAGVPPSARLDRLEVINAELARAGDVIEAIRLDEQWHRELWADCPNRVLIELIEQFIGRTRRYELASMSQQKTIRRTTEIKARIVEDLRAGRLDGACRKLRTSLTSGGQDVFDWLDEHQMSGAERRQR